MPQPLPLHYPAASTLSPQPHRAREERWEYAIAQAATASGASAMRWTNQAPPAWRHDATNHAAPLHGWLVTIKDLFDVQEQVTAAGSLVLEEAPPAATNAPAVQRLLDAGAHPLGRSHMVEFAFSGIGTNPHFAPITAVDAYHAPHGQPCRTLAQLHVSGGSSSGAALSVALGMADAGLGSDTGGSIRIPAAFNGLVGFKSTQALVPTAGMVPLSPSLDVACAITRNVADAITVHEVLAARTVTRSPAPLPAWRLAVVDNYFFDDSDATTRHAFARSLAGLQRAGASVTHLTLPALETLPRMAQFGTLPAAESHAWHQHLLATQGERYDPRVRQRIAAGAQMSATDYLQLQATRRNWQREMARALAGFDAVLSPTVAITAPLLEEVAPGAPRDAAFSRANGLVLRNTSAINLLDGSAISIPCHSREELPVGLMVWGLPGRDDTVLNVALLAERALSVER